jgi:hypothetical protein
MPALQLVPASVTVLFSYFRHRNAVEGRLPEFFKVWRADALAE